jgi:hypothetical protein
MELGLLSVVALPQMKVLFEEKRCAIEGYWPNWVRWERDFWRFLMRRTDSTRVISWARRSRGDADEDARRGVVASRRLRIWGKSFMVGWS